MKGLTTVMGWTLALAMVMGTAVWTQPARPTPIDGVWQLKGYKGGGNEGPASGVLILDRGHFSYVYTMNEQNAQPDGRGHAGSYQIDGEAMVFRLTWDVHFVAGKGTVNRPSESKTRAVLSGNTLTLTFPNGASQTLERLAPVR